MEVFFKPIIDPIIRTWLVMFFIVLEFELVFLRLFNDIELGFFVVLDLIFFWICGWFSLIVCLYNLFILMILGFNYASVWKCEWWCLLEHGYGTWCLIKLMKHISWVCWIFVFYPMNLFHMVFHLVNLIFHLVNLFILSDEKTYRWNTVIINL